MVPLTMAAIRMQAADGAFPTEALEGCDTALLLFAAGFHGRQDGIFVADAGLTATCVDIRPERLHEMAALYPPSWEFFVDDAFAFATQTERQWDVVSVDCPSGMFDQCADMVDVWCRLARRLVVLGTGRATKISAPDGWRLAHRVYRSDFAGGTCWTVLKPQ